MTEPETYTPAGVELSTDDVATWAQDRLPDDDRTELLLAAALAEARNYCGWHVTPERAETFTVDGHGGYKLLLPTRRLVEVSAVTENGVALDLDNIVSAPRGLLVKQQVDGAEPIPLRWSAGVQNITVEAVHGFAVAPDWRAAVLNMVDRMSSATVSAAHSLGGALAEKRVDDVDYKWQPGVQQMVDGSIKAAFDLYRLEIGP